MRERESAISDPQLCVFMRGGMECDSVHDSVEGQSKADMCVNWVVCVYAVTLPLIQLSKLLSDARD